MRPLYAENGKLYWNAIEVFCNYNFVHVEYDELQPPLGFKFVADTVICVSMQLSTCIFHFNAETYLCLNQYFDLE